MTDTTKPGKRNAVSLIFVLCMIVLSVCLIFHKNDWQTVMDTAAALRPMWIAAAFGCWIAHVMTDALILYIQLRKHQPVGYLYALYVTVMGSFYCAITPGSSGGQPMQVYYLSKRKVPLGVSTSVLSVKFAVGQISTVLITLILGLLCQPLMRRRMAEFRWLIRLGWIVHLGGVLLILMAVFCKRTVHKLADCLIKYGSKLRILRNTVSFASKCHNTIESYHANIHEALKRPKEICGHMLLSAFSLLFVMLIPACIYQAFGLHGTGWKELLITAYMLYLSASYNPFPGASGAQEGGFLVFYRGVFPSGQISMAMFAWRFFTYYLHLICGALLMLMDSGRHFFGHRKNKAAVPDHNSESMTVF